MENKFNWNIKITYRSWTEIITWKVSILEWSIYAHDLFHFSLDILPDLEYYPVRVRGKFDHSREILIEPRTRLDVAEHEYHSNARQPRPGQPAGAHVITPFRVANRK